MSTEIQEKELFDWIAEVRVTNRARKTPTSDFVNSEAKAALGIQIRRIEREASEEDDLTANKEHVRLVSELKSLDAEDERVSWVDELEADQLETEVEVELLAFSHYHKTWNESGRLKYKGDALYRIEVLSIRKKAIQRPRIIIPGA